MTQAQTRSDSPCFVLQSTQTSNLYIPNNYENHEPILAQNSIEHNPLKDGTLDLIAPSDETNKSSSSEMSDQAGSSTNSDKSNSSVHGSMTFPVNGKMSYLPVNL